MILSCPTLLFTPNEGMVNDLKRQAGSSLEYLTHAPTWDAFDHLVAQIAFGLVVVDFAVFTDDNNEMDPERISMLVDESLEANSLSQIIVYDVPDEERLRRLIAAGVQDVVRSPLSVEELMLRIERAGETYLWFAQRNYFVGQSGHIFSLNDIIGDSEPMRQVFEQVAKISSSRSPVLIAGETGSGKELIAAAIHYNSPRREQAFIKVNCAALQDTLLESELFGHEKGSFTGALKQRIGRFEQANRGTLFLDEVGDMSPATQAKVLRVLQSQEFERLGGTRLIRVNVRIIAATNQVLEEAIADGRFREDLYYRLNVVSIYLPPLRDRRSDIPLLANFFLKKARFEERKQVKDFSPEAVEFMMAYDWPGNVRELENSISRAVLLAEGDSIRIDDLAVIHPGTGIGERETGAETPTPGPEPEPERALEDVPEPVPEGVTGAPEGASLEDMEKRAIVDALEQCAYVQSRAARLLGISRRALNYKISKYGITHASWRVNRP